MVKERYAFTSFVAVDLSEIMFLLNGFETAEITHLEMWEASPTASPHKLVVEFQTMREAIIWASEYAYDIEEASELIKQIEVYYG